MAAILAAGEGAAPAGPCAAALLPITRREPREIEVIAPGAPSPPSRVPAVEIDGAGHARPSSRVDDRIRDAALQAAGYVVLRFTEDDLNRRPQWVLAQLVAQELPRRVARQ